jgi:hypothetical protein
MYRITIPPDSIVAKIPYQFRTYLAEVILPLPFWRTRDGAALASQLMDLIDSTAPTYDVTPGLHDALCREMALANQGLGQLNPQMARPSIRNIQAVYDAEVVKEEVAPATPAASVA